MSTAVQRRRGTTAQHASFAGLNGELTIDTDKEVVVVHDGATAGGYPQMRENGSNSALALGSAGTPSLKFTGDTNTGIYSPGADQVAISTGGSGRLFVGSAGNVGIGTGSPSTLLHAAGTVRVGANDATDSILQVGAGATGDRNSYVSFIGDTTYTDYGLRVIRYGGANAQSQILHRGTGSLDFLTSNSAAITFNTTNTERLRVTSTGLVGIGTSSPGARFHVEQTAGASAVTEYFRLTSSSGNDGMSMRIAGYAYAGNARTAIDFIQNASSNFQSKIAFSTSAGADAVERVRIDEQGRVGIGTSSPTQPLDVVGNTNGSTGQRIRNDSTGASAQAVLTISAAGRDVTHAVNYTGQYAVESGSSITTKYRDFDTHIWRNNAGTERLRITSAGLVGIGTSSPAGTIDLVAESTNGYGLRMRGRASDNYAALQFITNDGTAQNAYIGATSNTLAIGTGNSERVRIDSSGRVGIGNTNPGYPLDVLSESAGACLRLRGGSGGSSALQFTDNALSTQWGAIVSTSTSTSYEHTSVIQFKTASTERARITSDGKLGIGISSPNGLIHLQGTSIAESWYTATGTGGATWRVGTADAASGLNGAYRIYDSTNSAARLLIDSSGRVGIGITSPATNLDLFATDCKLRIRDIGQTNGLEIYQQNSDGGSRIFAVNNNYIALGTNNTERARIDSSGRLLVGTSSARQVGTERGFQVEAAGALGSASIVRNDNGSAGAAPVVVLGRSRGASNGSNTIVQADDDLGYVIFAGADGSSLNSYGAWIRAQVDGAPGTNDMPGRLVFSTTADGASSPTERMRISSDGAVKIAGDNFQIATSKTPASATAAGTTGQVAWDASYIYVCTATNTWKRAALSTW